MIVICGNTKVISKKNKMRLTRSGKVYKQKDVIAFENYVKQIAIAAMNGSSPLTGDVQLHLHVIFGDKRRRDLPNCYDVVCDSLQGIVYLDDSQITKLSGTKEYKDGVWEFEITVCEI